MPLELRQMEAQEPEIPGLPPDAGNMRAAAAGKPAASPNLKEALRRKFEALEKTRTGDFDVPGYDGMLVARYRRMTTEEVVEVGEHSEAELTKAGNDRRAMARASAPLNADFLAAACIELFARKDGVLQPLGEGFAMRYDASFAEMMGYEVTPEEGAREIVLRTFDHNELALKRHADEVDEWMTSLTAHTEEDYVGK